MGDKTSISWTDHTKWCTSCKTNHVRGAFGRDRSRGDGLAARCLASRRVKDPRPYRGGRPRGWLVETRDGNKTQARARVRYLVRVGRLPRARTLPCVDCGHVWSVGARRHEYDHHRGYSREHQLDVEPVCSRCHHKRDNARARQTHCKRGHEYTAENTFRARNGTRHCRECRRAFDRHRRDAAFWRAYRAKRRGA